MHSYHQTLTKSQRHIIDGFIKLLDEMEPREIRILDILRASGVSRTTFYNYFDSKEALVEFCLSAYFDRVAAILSKDSNNNDQVMVEMLTFLKQNRLYTRALTKYYPSIDQVMTDFIIKMIKQSDIKNLETKLEEGYHFPEKYAFSIYVMTYKTIIFDWIKSDFQESPMEINAIINQAVQI